MASLPAVKQKLASLPVVKQSLFKPSLEDAVKVLKKGLDGNFEEVSCEVVTCPDLTQEPYGLANKGLSGSPRVGEAGGVPFLCPFPKLEKLYNLKDIAELIDLPDGFMIGAGAGPHPYVGINSEMIPNLTTGKSAYNASRIAKVGDDNQCVLQRLPEDETRCAILLNFFSCEGKTGPVIKVSAKKRTGPDDFVGCMRKALEAEYGDKAVGVGGAFVLKKGTVKIHVMPDFSEKALKSEAEVMKWLKFYDMKAPMVFMSVFVSKDPGLDIRTEHTHGYGDTEGGHYHFDTTPDEVEYEGYFNLADLIYRVDKP